MLNAFLVTLSAALISHADQNDERLLAHFAVGTKPITQNSWQDFTGKVIASIEGSPKIRRRGPTDCLEFFGQEKLILRDFKTGADIVQPTDAFSTEAWICLDETSPDGRVISRIGEEQNQPLGWALGYVGDHWNFLLSASKGKGGWTKVVGRSPIRKGCWHYVAATYDGKSTKLFVDGRLEAESNEAAGPIKHPKSGDFILGGLFESSKKVPMRGALFEVKVYGRALSSQEIMMTAIRNSNLIAWKPEVESGELSFLVKPMLQFGTQNSMTIVCETSQPTKVDVSYGGSALFGKKVSTSNLSSISEVTISGLEPNTRYFYRVECADEKGRTLKSEIRSFQTAITPDRAWAFAIVGDTQRNPEVTKKCADGAYALRPNFMLHCGDVVDDGFAKNQWIKDLFEPCSELLSNIPMYPVIGNHEKDSHWYYDYFALPKPEYYYTFHYGNAQFFMLDTNRPLKPGSEQYVWLEKELAASKAAWKIAAHHHPCFSSDEDDYGDHVRGKPLSIYGYGHPNAKQAIALYEKYGVDIVFNGHIHVYERTWPILNMSINLKKGVRYITSGGGGGHLESPAPQRTWFSLHVNKAYHYCHTVVFDRNLIFKAYDIEGRLFDTFEMTKADDR